MRRGIIAIGMGLALAGPVQGKDPAPFKDFTFKRIGTPKSGAGKRITVQITPNTPEVAATTPEDAAPAAPTSRQFDWFWTLHSPDLSAAGPVRLANALSALRKAPAGASVPAPRLQLMQDIAGAHGRDILVASIGTKVSPALILAVIAIESSGRPEAVSTAGAVGLMQLMPATATLYGVADSTDPTQNIAGGTKLLDALMNRYNGDPALVLAAYNAGETAVSEHGGVPPFAETRAYVPKVLAAWSVAKGLCLTPPELLSDGCVFAVQKVKSDG